MTRLILATMMLVMLTGCGIRKPLMRPSQIPAYEEKRARKREQLEQENKDTPADTTDSSEQPK